MSPRIGDGYGSRGDGSLERLEATTFQYGTHAITDEASETFYALRSEVLDLDAHADQRVTVYGTLVPGYENGQVESSPPLLKVTRVEPAGDPSDGEASQAGTRAKELPKTGSLPVAGLLGALLVGGGLLVRRIAR